MKNKYANKALVYKIIMFLVLSFNLTLQLFTLKSTINIQKIAEKETESTVIPCTSTSPMLSKDVLYYLYECGGKIGIYDAKSGILIDVADVFTSSLLAQDRKMLKSGIAIYSFSDLSKILDDFSS